MSTQADPLVIAFDLHDAAPRRDLMSDERRAPKARRPPWAEGAMGLNR
jgi:hypothetical protein